jgi:hypothetical protein
MDPEIYTQVNDELSGKWLDLSSRVRKRADDLQIKAIATPLAAEATQLNADLARLCDHVERIHRDVGKLISGPEEAQSTLGSVHPDLKSEEVQREAVRIHQENHEIRADFKDIIKALFMWQEDPVERTREKRETQETPPD